MASINKLSIRGVRAFSPEDEEQVVEFFFPCTIIVGANGCGKTTIIESLKYAVTGSMPPGTKSGHAFVHDPRSSGQTQVKANVKLRFTSRAGESLVVVRSMEVTQKKKNLQFKQLDGVLRMMDRSTGQRVSLSHKCSELDRQIPNLLGVSKAILDSVVFCHQEDSSWPLQEGAVLKKKFDDIFDSTRYTKALESVRKTEKEMLAKCKEYKTDLAGLASHQHAAKGFRSDLDKHNENLEELEQEKKDIKTTIQQAEEDMQAFSDIVMKVDQLQDEIRNTQTLLEQQRYRIETKKESIAQDLTTKYSHRELEQMQKEFDKKVDSQREQLQELQAEHECLLVEIETLRKQEIDLNSQMGRIAAEREANDKRIATRYSLMNNIAHSYQINLTSSQTQDLNRSSMSLTAASQIGAGQENDNVEITPEDMQIYFETLNKKQQELQAKLKEQRERTQEQEDQIQSLLTDLKGKLSAAENEKRRVAEQRRELESELSGIKEASVSTRRLQHEIEETRKSVKQLAKQREEANRNPRRTEIPVEIRQCEDKMEEINRQNEFDRALLDTLRHTAETQNALAVLKEQSLSDLEVLEESLKNESFTLKKFNLPSDTKLPTDEDDEKGDIIIERIQNIQNLVEEKFNVRNSALRKATDERYKAQESLAEKSAVLASHQKTLAWTKTRLNNLEADGGSVSQVGKMISDLRRYAQEHGRGAPPNEDRPRELLNYLDAWIENVDEDDVGPQAVKTAKKVLKTLANMAKTERGDLACPCCKRGLDEAEAVTFVETIRQLRSDAFSLVEDKEGGAEMSRKMKEQLQSWRKFLSESMDDLRDCRRMFDEVGLIEADMHQIEGEIEGIQRTLDSCKEEESEIRSEVDELSILLDNSKRWYDDAQRIAERRLQIIQKSLDISSSTGIDGRDLKTVEKDMDERNSEKDNLATKVNALNREMATLNNKIFSLSEQHTRKEDLLKSREEKFFQEQKAIDRKNELRELTSKLNVEEKKAQDQIAPLTQKIRSKEQEKTKLRNLARDDEEALADTISQFCLDIKHLQDLSKQIEEYESASKSKDQDNFNKKIASIQYQQNQKIAERGDILPRLEEARKKVDDQESYKKLLRDNIELIEDNKQARGLEDEISALCLKLEDIEGRETAHTYYSKAKQLKEEKMNQVARMEGRWHEIVEQVRSLKRKLLSEEYKDVDEQYRVAMIKYETTNIAAEDLKKYYTALDKALLKYHSVKIKEINKIIRELWLLTYKGEDISNIEIVSGEDGESRASKSYNYRVVMTKGGCELDMRGRCSAGQRVLASIVIRLALAETFCINCGCIALDEPTVNLDYRNKKGLAVALAQIVASRAQQRNFQLILITHDEEFVSMMKTELSSLTGFSLPEKYYQVCREAGPDGKYYSKIHGIDWDELT